MEIMLKSDICVRKLQLYSKDPLCRSCAGLGHFLRLLFRNSIDTKNMSLYLMSTTFCLDKLRLRDLNIQTLA